jgi:hypothetical protein
MTGIACSVLILPILMLVATALLLVADAGYMDMRISQKVATDTASGALVDFAGADRPCTVWFTFSAQQRDLASLQRLAARFCIPSAPSSEIFAGSLF